jgi:hypothetical protein
MGSPVCTATEDVPPGYIDDQTDCVNVNLLDDGECTIANSLRTATFLVAKDFVDETNPMAVPMTLTCTSGTVMPEMANATEGNPAEFTVTGFEPGATCTATEAPVYGYIPNDTDCQDGDPIADGETSQCTITNTLRRANLTVSKVFGGEEPHPESVSVSLDCSDGTVTASPLPAAPGDPAVFEVTGFEGDPNCQATEDPVPGYVEDQTDCFSVALVSDGACTITNTKRTDQFVVMKTYDEGSEPVSVSLECSSGEVTNSPQDAAPGEAAFFDVVGYEGDPTCTATEVVPPGYDADQDDCQNVPLLDVGECTISNTLRRANFTVSKVFSGDGPHPESVSVSLDCESGTVTESPLLASPDNPAEFEVTGYDGDPNCTATEEVPYGYDADQDDCQNVALLDVGACTITNTLRSAEFRVSKVYDGDENTDSVSVSLDCTDGTVTESPLDAAPEADAVFVVTGYEGEPTCTATEEVPSGYDGDDSDCENVGLVEPGACTITNTLRVADFTVYKEYEDESEAPVSVSLECASGEVTESPLMADPDNPAEFEVTGYDGDPNCQATEEVPEGYKGDASDCLIVPLVADGECTIVNSPIRSASFLTTKDFVPHNDAGVTAVIKCNTGLPLEQDYEIFDNPEPGSSVNFVVTDFEAGAMDCVITELEVPEGYSVEYKAGVLDGEAEFVSEPNPDGCSFGGIVGDGFTCEIINTALPATYTVYKDWVVNFPGGNEIIDLKADVTIKCNREILNEGAYQEADDPHWYLDGSLGDGGSLEAKVAVTVPGAECSASEDLGSLTSGVEPYPDGGICPWEPLGPGGSESCTFTNTIFFEGIPTLNQYGLALLALLMLGIGAVGLRRFV